MDVKLLIDSILRQTTVLIAQLSTTAGIRAPLAHMADEVFLELSRELESQGLPRKIVADMFGLALRGYQKRVHRVEKSAGSTSQTLWQAVFEYLQDKGPLPRRSLMESFAKDDPGAVGAILNDLLASGLAWRTGSGERAVYGATREEERSLLAREGNAETVQALLWLEICRHPGCRAADFSLPVDEAARDDALAALVADGRVTLREGCYFGDGLTIPVGAEAGWEVAVFDHFQSVCVAIATKLQDGATRSQPDDRTGGATFGFDLCPGHPRADAVRALLSQVRAQVVALWEEVEDYNRSHPLPEEERERVTFYFGQYARRPEESP